MVKFNLRPGRGTIFVIAEDAIIPESKNSEGFGPKTKKREPEVPYKFRVIAVGPSRPYDGVMVDSEVVPGDVVITNTKNYVLREEYEDSGFLWNGQKYLAFDFKDVLGIID